MGIQDKVTLSVKERQQLARLQSTLESADPGLARMLGGRASSARATGPGPLSYLRHAAGALAARSWAGPVFLLAGLAMVVGTVPWLVWLSIPGALLAAAGLGLVFHTLHPFLAAKTAELAARTANAGMGPMPRRSDGPGTGDGGSDEDGRPER